MLKIFLAITLMCFSGGLAYSESKPVKQDIRNPTGKLLYKTTTRGNTTEVRSPTGKLLMKSKTTGNKTEVRSPTGKLLETIKTK
ncbi:MAG: hypothetical protein ACYDHG_08110 [Desulfomonilaceae bacterium]